MRNWCTSTRQRAVSGASAPKHRAQNVMIVWSVAPAPISAAIGSNQRSMPPNSLLY